MPAAYLPTLIYPVWIPINFTCVFLWPPSCSSALFAKSPESVRARQPGNSPFVRAVPPMLLQLGSGCWVTSAWLRDPRAASIRGSWKGDLLWNSCWCPHQCLLSSWKPQVCSLRHKKHLPRPQTLICSLLLQIPSSHETLPVANSPISSHVAWGQTEHGCGKSPVCVPQSIPVMVTDWSSDFCVYRTFAKGFASLLWLLLTITRNCCWPAPWDLILSSSKWPATWSTSFWSVTVTQNLTFFF